MSIKSPIFSISQPQHFSDYGFDSQIDYFQVLEEARRHKRETTRSNTAIDTLHFKLQKPISRDESSKKIKKNNKRLRWWKNALHFFKWKLAAPPPSTSTTTTTNNNNLALDYHYKKQEEAAAVRSSGTLLSGPIYVTESRSGSSTPYRTTNRPSSGPLAGNLSPAQRDELQIRYICLRDVNDMDNHHQQYQQRMSTSAAMPIYLVT